MKHVLLTTLVALAVGVSARADLKLTENVTGKGLGLSGTMASTTYIKGLKMRTDVQSGDKIQTTIFDVENQKLYMFDSKKKEADVWDMADFSKQIGSVVDAGGTSGSFKANGQSKQIGGKTATGYDMNIVMPTTMGDAKNGMQMTVTLSGTTWIIKGAPGTADFQKFYVAAADKGFVFSDPRAAKAQPGQAKARTQMYREMAATGGVPYETQMNIKMSGEGPMAGIMARMGNMEMLSNLQNAEVVQLADDMFAPPAGYKVSAKK
jgi:hypothetical protein